MGKIFSSDRMGKRERVEATLNHQSVDRCALLEQLSYNPRVIADWTGKKISGFDYTLDDICEVIGETCDLVMPPAAPKGTSRVTSPDGFVTQHDNWTSWHVSRPFSDEHGAAEWLRRRTATLHEASFDAAAVRDSYRNTMLNLQEKIGDTVILKYSMTGFCSAYDGMGLEIFTFFQIEYPEVLKDYLEASVTSELRRIHAVADPALSPLILIPEDFATKQGPIFPPSFLHEYHYPYISKLAAAWHEHGVKALYHSDGNWKKVVPDLIACGVDGFYCLEPNCGMDIVELKNTWPEMVWAGGVDGVDLMERGTPEQVKTEVRRHIRETNALETGGMFVASSSEINPPIPPENFRAMVEAVREPVNKTYA
ncbi:MAG: uroporphyrinogen decarboxylase family protein [Victivallales bacterium]